jgi:hypothetical protein
MSQERDQRRLVNITPAQVVATGDIVEFVAEISIAIVEVDVKKKLGKSNGTNDRHSVRKGRLPPLVECVGGTDDN